MNRLNLIELANLQKVTTLVAGEIHEFQKKGYDFLESAKSPEYAIAINLISSSIFEAASELAHRNGGSESDGLIQDIQPLLKLIYKTSDGDKIPIDRDVECSIPIFEKIFCRRLADKILNEACLENMNEIRRIGDIAHEFAR